MLLEVRRFASTAEAVAAFDRQAYHVCSPPSLPEAGQGWVIIAAVLKFKPKTPDTYYIDAKRGWALAKPALIDLAMHAGIDLGKPNLSQDLDGSPLASVLGKVMSGPGVWRELAGTYSVARERRKEWNQAAVDGAFNDHDRLAALQRRDREARLVDVYGVQMAETGAMLRCIRAHLGIEHTYSAKALRLPFVVMRLAPDSGFVVPPSEGPGSGFVVPPSGGQESAVTAIPPPTAQEEPQPRPNRHLTALANCRIAVLNAGRARFGVDDEELLILAGQTMKKAFWQLSLEELGELMAKWSGRPQARPDPDPFAETRGVFQSEQELAQAERPLCITPYCDQAPVWLVRWNSGPFRGYCQQCFDRSVANGCIQPGRTDLYIVRHVPQPASSSVEEQTCPS